MHAANLSPLLPPVACTLRVASARLGIGRTMLYQLIAADELRTFKLGNKTMLAESELQRFVAERMKRASVAEVTP